MIERLAWDSELFGYEVGLAKVEKHLDIKQFNKESKKFRLVYIFSHCHLLDLPDSFQFVDTKITFKKKLNQSTFKLPQPIDFGINKSGWILEINNRGSFFKNNKIEAIEDSDFYSAFFALALESGELSRFNTDKKLKNGEFEKLYNRWANNALEGKGINLVFITAGNVHGMATLGINKGYSANVGLMVVSKEFRSLGIGKQLIQAVCLLAGRQGVKSLTISTQKANYSAVSLYLKTGFVVKEEINVYHWSN